MRNLRLALRQLRKSPGFAAVAVLTLGLGIGANTAIFSVVNAVLLRPLPYPDPDRLIVFSQTHTSSQNVSVSFPDYLDYRRDNTVFEHLAVSGRRSYGLSGLDGREAEQISGAIVTANFFKAIGLEPQIGRTFNDEEDRVGGPKVVVLSDKLWERLFQRDRSILGRTLTFGGEPYTVLGVMPPQMSSPRQVDAWFPLMPRTAHPGYQGRGNHPGLTGWGRLKPGGSVKTAQAEMTALAQRLEQEHPQTNKNIGVRVRPLLEEQVGEYRTSLRLLLCAVGVVLLIACANLANLLAARGAARAREFAIRTAIGATRWQIIRQLLLESLVLAVLGGLLGIFLAACGRDLLVALAPPDRMRFQETRLDGWVLLFSGGLSIATSLLFGLWPAWQTSRADAQSALKAGAHGSSDAPAARRSREWLIISEIALTLVLLSAAGLVLKSFANSASARLGFEPQGLATAQIVLRGPSYDADEKILRFSTSLLEKMRTMPGVEHAAIASTPPLVSTTWWQTGFTPEGMPPAEGVDAPSIAISNIMGDYFAALGTPLLRGRNFTPQDTKDAPQVTIIDQLTAERYFPGQDAIGKRIALDTREGKKLLEIVGIVPRLKLHGYEEGAPLAQGYVPQYQVPTDGIVLLLRTSRPTEALERNLRQLAATVDPTQPVYDVRSMQDRVAETWATPRLLAFLLGTFAGLALLLAVVGIYGVMAYNGQRRTREIGVRLALGARRQQIVGMMLNQGMRMLGIGLLLGFGGALAASRVLRSLLFEVSATDPTVYIGVAVVLAAAAAIACWVPARRASRVNPMITLRSE
jgi:putative ABC transport system permease protein